MYFLWIDVKIIIYTIAYIAIIGNVPTFVGAILLFTVILVFIVAFIYVLKKDRTKEIEEYYNDKKQNSVTVQNDRRTAEDLIREYSTTKATENLKDDNYVRRMLYNCAYRQIW